MTEKSSKEIASEITIAWINALGNSFSNANTGMGARELISSSENIADFYKTIYKAVKED